MCSWGKNLDEEDFVKEPLQLKELCRCHQIPLIVNDSVDVALKSGADGVHVGIEDTSIAEIPARVGKNFIMGVAVVPGIFAVENIEAERSS